MGKYNVTNLHLTSKEDIVLMGINVYSLTIGVEFGFTGFWDYQCQGLIGNEHDTTMNVLFFYDNTLYTLTEIFCKLLEIYKLVMF